MKTMIQLVLVMALFGGAAAGGTFYWQKFQTELKAANERAEVAEAKAAEDPLRELQKPTEPEPVAETHKEDEKPVVEPPVAARPPYVEGVDETSQLVIALNQRLRVTQEKEQKLDERQEALKLIFADVRAEQAAINKLRQQVSDEFQKSSQSAQDALKSTQAERDLLREELKNLKTVPAPSDAPGSDPQSPTSPDAAAPNSSSKKSESTKTETDPATLKRLGAIYDSMPADVVAEVLLQLTKQGRDSVVVEILQSMKDRQAAKVLAAIGADDAAKAATLTEQLKQH